jgi:hypothetical protein
MSISDTNSYSAIIRDILFAKCCTLPFFDGFTARRCKQLPTQPYHLPFLGVYIMDENMTPDGDWNVGEIRFIHDLKLAFSVQMEGNDPLALELKLDEAFWAIMNGCWKDQYLANMLDTYNPHTGEGNPDNTRFEGIYRGHRRHVWGAARLNNETPWAELQFEPTIRYRTYWPPIIEDELERITVDVVPLHHGKIPSADEVQRIISKYEFTADARTESSVDRLVTTK